MLDYLKSLPQRIKQMRISNRKDIKYALIVFAVLALLVFSINKARAEFTFEPYLFLFVEYETHSTFCYKDQANEQANLGVGVKFYESPTLDWHARYAHDSCIIGNDRGYSDDFGVGFIWRPGK